MFAFMPRKRKRKVSLICARPFENNPGMLSVDLAFEIICRRHNLDLDIVRYCFAAPPPPVSFADGSLLQYRCMRGRLDEIFMSDAIIFWGDFLHAWNYQYQDILQESMGCAVHDKPAQHEIRRHLLFSDAPDNVFRKTLSCGSTLVGDNEALLILHTDYREALTRFLRSAARIWMRDPYSALQVAHMRSDYRKCHAGVDCGLFLRPEDMRSLVSTKLSSNNHSSGHVAVHFGRIKTSHVPMLRFAESLCRKLGRTIKWVPWLHADEKYIGDVLAIIPAMEIAAAADYSQLIGEILKSSLVITDTYHMALIAWRVGIPAICLGLAAQHPKWTISDKKKEIFYYMYNASPYYVYAGTLVEQQTRESLTEALIPLLANRDISNAITDKISSHAEHVEQAFISALKNILQS